MPSNPYTDDLPARQSMRDPHKSRHHAARFTTRTAPARYRADDRVGR